MSNSKAAIITGGASGLGLGVAETLLRKGWRVHIFDLNEPSGSRAIFHKVDVASWESLSSAFDAVFEAEPRLDFVFANAGIMEKGNFYERHNMTLLPPEPQDLCFDINLKGVVNTSYLAQHYFRANSAGGSDCVLIITSSIAGIYPQEITPIYAATKAGILNFMRSIAPVFYHEDRIRTYAICPGSVRTNLLPKELWDAYPQEFLTQMEKVTSTVEKLVEGSHFEDSWGKKLQKSDVGLAVEIFVDNIYFRGPAEPCNSDMALIHQLMRPGKSSLS
ncbi:15-hydroxyprostaglandin dehydrogenase [Xylariaceae sp. FL0662B]|nr:15-hydroxyprostaglandin dehydrogenase [Xylariaceae sp. FL0662B]